MESYRSREHERWGGPEAVLTGALRAVGRELEAPAAGRPAASGEAKTETRVTRSHQRASSSRPPGPPSCEPGSASEGQRAEAATCGLRPNSHRPGAGGAPRGRWPWAHYQGTTGRSSGGRGFHNNAGRAVGPQRRPHGQRSSLWQRKLPGLRRLGRAGFAALRRGAPGTRRRGARGGGGPRGLWPRVTPGGSPSLARVPPALQAQSEPGIGRPDPRRQIRAAEVAASPLAGHSDTQLGRRGSAGAGPPPDLGLSGLRASQPEAAAALACHLDSGSGKEKAKQINMVVGQAGSCQL